MVTVGNYWRVTHILKETKQKSAGEIVSGINLLEFLSRYNFIQLMSQQLMFPVKTVQIFKSSNVRDQQSIDRWPGNSIVINVAFKIMVAFKMLPVQLLIVVCRYVY